MTDPKTESVRNINIILKIIFSTESEHKSAKILSDLDFFSTNLNNLFLYSSVEDPGKIQENSFKITKYEREQKFDSES